MAGCICRSSGVFSFVAVGLVGVAAGVLGSRAVDSRGKERPLEPSVVAALFQQPEGQPSQEDMMKEMAKWAAPAPEHEVLQRMVGTWDCQTKFWMGPGDPITGAATSETASVLGGRFVTQHFAAPDMMGQPFEGMGATGYDKAKGKYVAVWIDNFNTGVTNMEGEYDKAAKTMTWTGHAVYPDGKGGSAESPIKHVIKYVSPDKIVMEFWEPPAPGEEMVRSGEITYSRRK